MIDAVFKAGEFQPEDGICSWELFGRKIYFSRSYSRNRIVMVVPSLGLVTISNSPPI
jgi:hypothetical protein